MRKVYTTLVVVSVFFALLITARGTYSQTELSNNNYKLADISYTTTTTHDTNVNGIFWNLISEINDFIYKLFIHTDNSPTIPESQHIVITDNSVNLINNGNFETDNFGTIDNWSDTQINLGQWYLKRKIINSDNRELSSTWVNFSYEGVGKTGYGIKNVDEQVCDYFCSSEAVQIVPANENTIYILQAESYKKSGNYGVMYLDFLNNNRVRIKANTSYFSGDGWFFGKLVAVSPPNTNYIRVILYSNNNDTGIVYWDNVLLTSR